MRSFVPFAVLALLAVAGCTPRDGIDRHMGAQQAGPDSPRPQLRPDGQGAAPPPDTAALQPDAARAAALPAVAGHIPLGQETATLGDASQPGLWLLTRHVGAPVPGRVVNPATGRATPVDLRPSGGAGGRLSLMAMQALGLPLTALAQVDVYAVE